MRSIREYYRESYADQVRGAPGPESEATFRERVAAALDVLGDSPLRVLDYGCGTGAATDILARRGHTAIGVDISESGIRLARQRKSGTYVLADDESRVPFQSGSFDACFSTEVIEHLFHVEAFLSEMHRLVKPDGLLLLTTPYHGWMKNMVVAALSFDHHFDPASGHIRFFSRASLSRMLRGAGFEPVHFRGIGRAWPLWKSMFLAARRT